MQRCLTFVCWVSFAAMPTYSDVPCASCHAVENRSYAQTRMATAAVAVLESAFARDIESVALREPGNGYQFRYKKNASNVTVISFRGSDSAVGAIDWVLGSGAQGQTPLVKSGQTLLESRVSFFPNLHQYGITIGQNAAASANAIASLGRPQTSADAAQCLSCHATALDAAFTKIVPGVQCEKCHPGASLHASGKGMPVNPGKLLAGEQVRLCGNCHRNSAPVDEQQIENIRFQPLRLMKSKCFERGKIACTTCHMAHQDARRDAAAFYNTKCVVCHGGAANHISARDHGDCIGCHMPQIQLHPALRFTDHFIRVVRSTDYPPGIVVAREGEFR